MVQNVWDQKLNMTQSIININNPGILAGLSPNTASSNGGDGLPVLLDSDERSTTGNFVISAISGAYYSLFLYTELRTDASGFNKAALTFNGAGAGYSYNNVLYYNDTPSIVSSSSNSAAAMLFDCAGTSDNTDTFGACVIEITNYAGAYNSVLQIPKVRWQGFVKTGSTLKHVIVGSGKGNSTSAITQINLTANSGTGFISGSWYKLYGI